MTQLGKYELFEQLGRGGFGIVYRARDTALNVERAVKALHSFTTGWCTIGVLRTRKKK